MRRFLLWSLFVVLLLMSIGVAVAVGIHSATLHGMTVTVDGETISGPMFSVMIGGLVALGFAIVALVLVAVLASVAIVVPVVLALVAIAIAGALVVGLSPVLVPVLLLVGAYVLLSRRSKRPAPAATLPPSATLS